MPTVRTAMKTFDSGPKYALGQARLPCDLAGGSTALLDPRPAPLFDKPVFGALHLRGCAGHGAHTRRAERADDAVGRARFVPVLAPHRGGRSRPCRPACRTRRLDHAGAERSMKHARRVPRFGMCFGRRPTVKGGGGADRRLGEPRRGAPAEGRFAALRFCAGARVVHWTPRFNVLNMF